MLFKKHTLALALAVASMAALGSANAGTLTDDFNITLQVDAMCAIIQPAGDISMIHDATGGNLAGSGNSALAVACNLDLPYTLEVDTDFGGGAVLTDAAIGKSVLVNVQLADNANGVLVPWSSAINSGQFDAIGTGSRQDYTINASYALGRQPSVGVYTTVKNITLNF